MIDIDWIIANADWLSVLLIISIFTIFTIKYYTKFDEYESEPLSKLILAFIFGVLSIVPSILISLGLISAFPGINSSVIIAPFAEEIGKGLFVVWLARSEEFDGPLDGLIYGGLVGAGFAFGENILYGLVALLEDGILAGIVTSSFRSIFQIVGHPFFTGLFGYHVGKYKIGQAPFKYLGLWKPMLAHAIWNFTATIGGLQSIGGLIIVGLVYLWYLKRKFSDAKELDKNAYERGYYNKNSSVPYAT